MSDLHFGEWQPESPFTELEGEAGAGYEEDESELEYEARTPLSGLSRIPLGIPQGPPAPPTPPAPPAAPKIGSTAKLTAGLVFVKIEGTTSGPFPGNMTQKGREGWIAASGFAHEVKSPRDVASGLPTGRRQHGPVTLTLPWSSASPVLFSALVTNEVLKSVVIEFVATLAQGKEAVAQRVTLTNASVSDLRRVNDRSQANQVGPVDIVEIAYEKITIDDPLGKQTAADDWRMATELEFEDAGPPPATEAWLGEAYQLEDMGAGG
jgi:type VI secretion system secreted protein Hcp